MDPTRIYFLNEYYLIENLTVRLVEMDTKIGYKLMLASKIEEKNINEFHIRINKTYFSNGELITVEDVKRSFERALKNKTSHVPLRELVQNLEIKEDVFIIKLKKKVNDFLYYLTLADLSILHKSQSDKDELIVEDWERVSSGAYIYKVAPSGVYLVKNPHFNLTDFDYPQQVKLLTARGRDTYVDFKDGKVDLGEFNINSFESHADKLVGEDKLQIIGNSGDMINFLALNVANEKFKDLGVRRWIQKKIISNFKLDTKYNNIARKAYQFYTPLVQGFVPENKILEEVESWRDINIDKVPSKLKDGITIHTYQRAFDVTLKSSIDNLEKVLGVPVKVENTVSSTDFEKFVKSKQYEVFLGITAMDQVIVGESINLYYFSSSPLFSDINGSIKKLMSDYQHSEYSNVPKVLSDISLQMIRDAECIPVFYIASPFFYNRSKLDVTNLDELTYFNLWKIKTI